MLDPECKVVKLVRILSLECGMIGTNSTLMITMDAMHACLSKCWLHFYISKFMDVRMLGIEYL